MIPARSLVGRILPGLLFLTPFICLSAGAQPRSPAARELAPHHSAPDQSRDQGPRGPARDHDPRRLSRDLALEFDGVLSSSAVLVPFHPAMNSYAATRQLTLEAWVKPGRVDTAGPIIQKAVGLCKDDWTFVLGEGLSIDFVAPNSCQGDGSFVSVPHGVRTNIWQHVAAVWDGDSMFVYVDGRRKGAAPFAGTPTTNQIGVSVGSSDHWDGNYRSFFGLIDEVRYSVTARYRGEFIPRTGWEPDSATIFHFDFNQGRTDTIVDPANLGLRASARMVSPSDDTPTSSSRPAGIDDNTIVLFKFDEVGWPAASGDAQERAYRTGRFGKAMAFQEPRDAIELPLQAVPAEGLTADCWLHIEQLPERGYLVLAEQRSGGDPDDMIWTLRVDPRGVPEFGISDGSAPPHFLRSPRAIAPGWHHVAGVWLAGKESQALFVDAECVASTLSSRPKLAAGPGTIVVGMVDEGARGSLELDEVRVSRRALLPQEFGVVAPPNQIAAVLAPEGVAVSFFERYHYPRPYRYRIVRRVDGQPDVDVALTDTLNAVDSTAPSGRVTYVVRALDARGFQSFESEPAHIVVPSRTGGSWQAPAIMGGLVLVGSVLAAWWMRRQKGRERTRATGSTNESEGRFVAGAGAVQASGSAPGIYLFGPMLVVNSSGKDITHLFSGKMRQLLQLLILRGNGNYGGVRSEELSEQIWPEEDLRSAKNSRNVLISRLRHALEPLQGANVVHKKGKWGFECSQGAYCDFLAVRQHLARPNHDELLDVTRLLPVLERGPLLKDESYPWLDPIRTEVHDQVVRLLLRMSGSPGGPAPDETRLRIAETMLLFEPLSEDALRLKVRLLTTAGRHAAARAAYDAFAREYRDVVGKSYSGPFPTM